MKLRPISCLPCAPVAHPVVPAPAPHSVVSELGSPAVSPPEKLARRKPLPAVPEPQPEAVAVPVRRTPEEEEFAFLFSKAVHARAKKATAALRGRGMVRID